MLVISQILGVTKMHHILNIQRLSALINCDIPTHKFPTYLFLNSYWNYFQFMV